MWRGKKAINELIAFKFFFRFKDWEIIAEK